MNRVLCRLWLWALLPVRADVLNPFEVIADVFTEKIVPIMVVGSILAVIAATVIILIILLKRKK